MGQLNQQYLNTYCSPKQSFIETGSYKGGTIDVALDFGFQCIYSIEMDLKLYQYCCEKYKHHDNVKLLIGDSPDVLINLLKDINHNCVFWLDAHKCWIPEKLSGSKKYGDSPVLDELDAIASSKYNHTIFIDDIRNFKNQKWNISLEDIIEKITSINTQYKIDFVSGGTSFGVQNPHDDILVAHLGR